MSEDPTAFLDNLAALEAAASGPKWEAVRERCAHVYPHRWSPDEPQRAGWTADQPVLRRPGETDTALYGRDWSHDSDNARGVSGYIPHDLALTAAARNALPKLIALARLAVEACPYVEEEAFVFPKDSASKDWLRRFDAIKEES